MLREDQLVAKLHKTRASIDSHRHRGLGLGSRGNINYRGCDLCDRYNLLVTTLHNLPEGYAAWKIYCDQYGSDYRHTGHDLFS